MSLMKFRAFNKVRKEIREQKTREAKAQEYKKIYLEKLSKYGASDASELTEEQLVEFLDSMKNYKIKNNTNEGNS